MKLIGDMANLLRHIAMINFKIKKVIIKSNSINKSKIKNKLKFI